MLLKSFKVLSIIQNCFKIQEKLQIFWKMKHPFDKRGKLGYCTRRFKPTAAALCSYWGNWFSVIFLLFPWFAKTAIRAELIFEESSLVRAYRLIFKLNVSSKSRNVKDYQSYRNSSAGISFVKLLFEEVQITSFQFRYQIGS